MRADRDLGAGLRPVVGVHPRARQGRHVHVVDAGVLQDRARRGPAAVPAFRGCHLDGHARDSPIGVGRVSPKLYEGEHAYLLQDEAKRIVFSIPYNQHTLIGTTETLFTGNPDDLHVKPAEIDYLCAVVNRYFKTACKPTDVMSTLCGIRTLVASSTKHPSALNRDYAYHFSTFPAPAVTIFSGKLTTYRQLAESAVNTLRAIFPHLPPPKTGTTPLPNR